MNETSLLINSGFALRQQDNKPVYTQIGERKETPYTATELKDLKEKLIKLYTKTGMSKENIKERSNNFKERMKGKTKKTDGKTDYPINLIKLQTIIITPKASGYISTAFIDFAKINNISIYWINSKSEVDASFMPFHFVKPSLVVKQAEARSNGKALEISKYLIKLKLESEGMKEYIPKIDKAIDFKQILQMEAVSAKQYYKKWEFSKEWQWTGRHGKASSNKNSVDPINSMLNLGYSILAQSMSEILLKRGFELSIGFMHQNETQKSYWNMLSYDLIEPFRTWTDLKVLEMISEQQIKPSDFTYTDDKMSLIFKDKSFDIAFEEFMGVVKPLEYKSLPMIREIEKML